MSLPALAPSAPLDDGLTRSARLMRALGSNAASVWSHLSPEEAGRISAAMEQLPENAAAERHILSDYVDAMRSERRPTSTPVKGVWQDLSDRTPDEIVRLIEDESPQVIAVILSQMAPEAAAHTVRALPRTLATEALKRLLNLGPVHPTALKALEQVLSQQCAAGNAPTLKQGGHAHVAQIFDRLDSRSEQSLLSALDGAEPGAGEKIRALMFTFSDLANLDPASLQTILVNVDRAVLTIALKDASPDVTAALFKNITQRAGDLLREDIAASGPVRRSEIEAARAEVLTIARTLVKRGDILGHAQEDELVE
ncbi:MAG: FliG C-terminal domain-containing protein [Pseudomonadota bacterium]